MYRTVTMVLLYTRNYLFVVFYLASLLIQDILMCHDIPRKTITQCGCLQRITNATSTSSCEINYKVGVSRHELGKIEIEIPYLSTRESGDYHIILRTNEHIDKHKKCNFSELNNCRQHSVIQYTIHEPQQCTSCPYQTIPTVTFQYVFSGLYNLQIESTDIMIQCHIDIKTDYKKEYLKKSVTYVQDPKPNTQRIEVIMHSSVLLRPPDVYTCLIEENCQDNCLRLNGVTHIYADATGSNNYRQEFLDSSENRNVTWSCSYKNISLNSTSYICTPVTLKPGRYSFTVDFLGEICTDDLQHWLHSNVCTANSILEINVLNAPIVSTYVLYGGDTNAISIVCSIAGIILVLAIFVVPIYIHRRFYIPPSSKQTTQSTVTNTSYISLLPPVNEIIVIYAKDNQMFAKMIEAFQVLLRSVENTAVIDINVMDENIFQQPQEWIRSKLFEKNTKIVLFLNNRIVYMYQKRESMKDMNSTWQDELILYTIDQLQFSKSVNYTNLFITHLSCITGYVESFDDLNTATRYIMPNTIQKLLRDIFKSQPNFNDNLLYNFNRLCQKCISFFDNHSV